MKKVNLENIFFILINICFTSLCAFLLFNLEKYFSNIIFPIVLESNKDIWLFLIDMGIIVIYLLTKPIIFLILYQGKKQFPYIHTFFNKFRTDRKYMWQVLGIVLLFDFICCSLYYWKMGFYIFVGLIFNYLIFLLFFPPVKKEKINEDGSINRSKIANIITNIVIVADILLIVFIILLSLLFLSFIIF